MNLDSIKGSMTQWFQDSVTPRLNKTMTRRLYDLVTQWLIHYMTHIIESMIMWQYDKWFHDSLTPWLNDSQTPGFNDSMTPWLRDSLTPWLTNRQLESLSFFSCYLCCVLLVSHNGLAASWNSFTPRHFRKISAELCGARSVASGWGQEKGC